MNVAEQRPATEAAARTHLDEAQAHADAERWDEALAAYVAAVDLWRSLGEPIEMAVALERLAATQWEMGLVDAALASFEEAATAFREAGETAGEARAVYAAAAALATQGRLDEAEAASRQAAGLWRATGAPALAARADARRARLLWRLDRREAAIEAMQSAVTARQAAPDDDPEAGEDAAALEQQLARMRAGIFPEAQWGAILPADEVEALIQNTVTVLTRLPERRDAWRQTVENARQDALKRGAGWRVEVELFDALLALVDGRPASLPAGHPYAPALSAIRAGIATGGPAEMPVAREVMAAIREFVGTEDWSAARHVVEERRDVLLQPEVDALFERNIEQAVSAGDARGAQVLALHRDLLRACREQGIEAGFAWLHRTLAEADARAAAAEAQDVLPPDFVDRCVAGFLGTAEDQVSLFGYLQGLGAFERGLRPLTEALQHALLAPASVHAAPHLAPAYADVWREIMAQVQASHNE